MVCEKCGEAIPENALVCPKCNHNTPKGTKVVLIGFIIAILIVTAIIVGFYIYDKMEQKKFIQEELVPYVKNMEELVNDYVDETDEIKEQLKQDIIEYDKEHN